MYQFIVTYTGERTFLKIVSDADMEEALIYLRKQHGIVGSHLTVKSNTVTGFNMEYRGTVFRICNLEVRDIDSFSNATNQNHYALFMENYERVNKALINTNHKSTYHPQFLDILHRYSCSPLRGQLQKPLGRKSVAKVDEVKAYTRRLMDLKYFPAFDEFCFFQPHDKQELHEYSIYFVKSPALVNQHDFLIFDKTYVLLYSITLLEADLAARCDVLYVGTPHKLIPNIMGDVIEELWKTDLPISHQLCRSYARRTLLQPLCRLSYSRARIATYS
jgi:hypothetical protein